MRGVSEVPPSPLRARRLLRGLRLKDVEQVTGIPDTTLSKLVRGEIPLLGLRLRKLADLYETPADILTREMSRFTGQAEMSPELTQAIYDKLVPGWRDAPVTRRTRRPAVTT